VNNAMLSNQQKRTYIMAEAQVPAGDKLQAVAVQKPAPDNPAEQTGQPGRTTRTTRQNNPDNPAEQPVQSNAGGEDITLEVLFHDICTSSPVLHVFGRFNSYCVLCYVYSLLSALRTVYTSFTVGLGATFNV
jgi:hypothetical protein